MNLNEPPMLNHEATVENEPLWPQKPQGKKTALQERHHKVLPNSDSLGRGHHPIIHLCTAYIEEHLSSKITLAQLVKVTGYSERSIQLAFKKHLKLSPLNYVEEKRYLRAKAMIESHKQNRKLSDIAQDVGLLHLGRFSVNFKRRFGLSPSVLQKV